MVRFGGLVVLALTACRPPTASAEDSEWSTEEGSAGASSAPGEKANGGAARQSAGGAPGEPTEPSPDSAAGGPSDADVSSSCAGQNVTLEQIHSGQVRAGVVVDAGRLVATSQKFLVSEAKSGSCLWGALAADSRRQGAGSGLFLVSFGPPHAEGETCQSGADALPDDLAPGDVVRGIGKVQDYVPAACDEVAPMQQLVLDAGCPLQRSGAAPVPEPSPIDLDLADRLAAGKDAELMRQWGGALVRLTQVSARVDEDGDAVFPFGVVRLAETSLELHSRLYYFDLTEGGPRSPGKAPRFSYPTAFQAVSGAVFLDYCSWVLAPRNRCTDLVPASGGCEASAERP